MRQPAVGHRIRLRGPWNIARGTESGEEFATAEVCQHPEGWPVFVQNVAGRVRLSRRFHAPTNVAADELVFVVLTGVCGNGEVFVNGTLIGRFAAERIAWEFLIPFELPFANELSIVVSYSTPSAAQPRVGVYDVVALEIRTAEA